MSKKRKRYFRTFLRKKNLFWIEGLICFFITFIAVLLLQPTVIRVLPFNYQFELAIMIGFVEFVSWLSVFGLLTMRHKEVSSGWYRDYLFESLMALLSAIIIIVLSVPVLRFRYIHNFELNWSFILNTVFCTFLVGFIIFSCVQIVKKRISSQNQAKLSDSQDEVLENDDESEPRRVLLIGKNKGEELRLDIANFIVAHSNGHYIEVKYFEKGGNVKSFVLRNTMSYLKSSLSSFEEIAFCHRSYLVNKNQIVEVLGDSRKTNLKMKSIDELIPVSRSNEASFLRKKPNW